jgi:hypothetical protein
LFLFPFLISGCNDWLDGAIPKDQNLEDDQYATEKGINSVLNGIYREIASETLYGGRLTLTGVELLANYHYYAENLLNNENMTFFNHMSKHLYGESDVMSHFSGIWSAAYKTIFRINNFIANVGKTTAVSAAKRDVLLGEAYALRAFIHLDLFRLFGDLNGTQTIPYNKSDEVIPHDPVADVAEFFNLLLQDINQAKTLLQNDPVRTDGIKDFAGLTNAEISRIDAEKIFAEYLRNYRINYFATLALQARALAFQDKIPEAAQIAQSALDEAFGDDKPFNWVNKTKILDDSRDYSFYSEILFGIHNMDLYSRWESYTEGTQPGKTYTVYIDNLQKNIFGQDITDGNMSLWEDIRSKQWVQSKIGEGQYVSNKFGQFPSLTKYNPKEYFQPLIRTGELHYIIAENLIRNGQISEAVSYLNDFRFHRGCQYGSLPDPATATEELAYNILETEYYKEFYGEGQAFFYLKRRGSEQIFNPNRIGKNTISLGSYIVPIPENELNN